MSTPPLSSSQPRRPADTPRLRVQLTPLVRACLARFFDNEITAGTNDLRQSFFWLIALLGVPCLMLPVLQTFNWVIEGHYMGLAALDVQSRPDKAFYLGVTMLALGGVVTLTWQSLLIDRRDVLVLGVLPVPPSRIVVAKILALLLYVGALVFAMHVPSSLPFGFLLAEAKDGTLSFALRGVVAHIAAGTAASGFVVFGATAVLGLIGATLGPRLMLRLSACLQIALVVTLGVGVFLLPAIVQAVNETIAARGANSAGWILGTPVLWYLGLYERVLGTSDPTLLAASRIGLWALGGVIAITLATYLPAYRRTMRTAVEVATDFQGRHNTLARWAAVLLARTPQDRAIVEFMLTSMQRVVRQRFVLGVAAGAALVAAIPVLTAVATQATASVPRFQLMALPLATMVLILVGLRLASTLPSELKAAWVFDIEPPSPSAIRALLERVLFGLGVLPLVVAWLPLHWAWWSADVAITHAIFLGLTGAIVVEALLQRVDGVPGTRGWRPERAQLRIWWPVYGAALLWLANGLPAGRGPHAHLEDLITTNGAARIAFFTIFAIAALALRRRGRANASATPPDTTDDVAAQGVLNISG